MKLNMSKIDISCDGTPHVSCDLCEGSGEIQHPKGQGDIECPSCEGYGWKPAGANGHPAVMIARNLKG